MSSFKDAYLTNNGAELIAEAIAEGVEIEFIKMVVGDGEYEDAEKSKDALQQRTGLKSLRQECGFSSVEATDENAVKLKAIIGNKNVTEGYRIREIGIIAKKSGDTTTEGILYSIAVAEEADYLPSEDTPISYIQEYYTKVSNAENVMINVNMGAYAAAEDVERLSRPIYKEPENLEELTSGEELETALGKIKKAVSTLIDHIIKKGSLSVLGHVKLSDSSAVTNSEGLALPATEKNASIKGTLANQIATQNDALATVNEDLASALKVTNVYNSFDMEANKWREITPEMAGINGITERIVAAIPLFVTASSGNDDAMHVVVVGSVPNRLSKVPNVRLSDGTLWEGQTAL